MSNRAAGREIGVISLSLVVLNPAIWMVQLAGQLLLVRLKPLGGLSSPQTLRVIAVAILVVPLWPVRSGCHSASPVEFAVQVLCHAAAFAFMSWRANVKAGRP